MTNQGSDYTPRRRPSVKGSKTVRPQSQQRVPQSAARPAPQFQERASRPAAQQHRRAPQPAVQQYRRTSQPQRRKAPTALIAAIAGVLVVALVAFGVGGLLFPSAPSSKDGAASSDKVATSSPILPVADEALSEISFTMSFTGDCIIANGDDFAYERSLPEQYDLNGPGYFFQNVKSIFDQDDYTVVDMECTLTDSTERTMEQFAFKADPSYIDILKLGGVQAGTLANNHTHDFGEKGYTDTWKTMENAGIVPFGYDDIAYVDIKGVKVALIGVYELDEYLGIMDNMLENIKKAKDNGATVTIVFQHWGEEKMYVPDTDQVTLGHAAIDAGADLVIGCHPHRVQGIEKYNGHYIAYSMGNFCFGGNMAPADMDCYIFQQTFTVKGKTVTVEDGINVIPCSISSIGEYNNYQPTPATGEEAERIMAKIDEISQQIPQI